MLKTNQCVIAKLIFLISDNLGLFKIQSINMFMLKFEVSKLTFLISDIISLGSLDEVVFMLQVNLNDRGLISPLSLTALLKIETNWNWNFLTLLSNLNIFFNMSNLVKYFFIQFVRKTVFFYLFFLEATSG